MLLVCIRYVTIFITYYILQFQNMPIKVRVFDSARTHDEAREKVCAVCINLWGSKAVRRVSEVVERMIQQRVLEGYTPITCSFPLTSVSGASTCCTRLRRAGKWSSSCQQVMIVSCQDIQEHLREKSAPACGVIWQD